ncbi:MAG: glycosyltransferase, partial [Cryobacterium sp.]|nr:glycosyltransferase [Cryobacterium sp.]
MQASAKALRSEGEQRVSVALCTYNGERFIEQQLASILSQSRPVDEIVVSDDGSTDGTVEIVRRVVSGNSRPGLKILQNSSALGVTANFEQAMAACTGEFICLSDQDDIWMPDRVELALEKFRERPELQLVHSNAELVDEQSDSLGEDLFRAIGFSRLERKRIRKGQALRVLLRRNVVTGATVMLRREL